MGSKQIGAGRFRGTVGRYYEEFKVGDVYEHRPGRTITDTDNINFSLLTMNFHPMHCDAAFAAKSEFGRLLVSHYREIERESKLAFADRIAALEHRLALPAPD